MSMADPPCTHSAGTLTAAVASRRTLIDAQFELVAHQAEVGAALPREFVVRALLDDAAAVEHDDLVGVAHRAQPMRDHQHRSAAAELDQDSP